MEKQRGEVVEEKTNEAEYLNILRALMELPFQVGRNLLADFLQGDYKNKSIINNKLDELYSFGILSWNREEIFREIDRLVQNGMIEYSTSDYNRFVKILRLTIKGINEISHPTIESKQLKNNIKFGHSEITKEDRIVFDQLESFLKGYNEDQKKAIICDSEKILCIAGAGSGKTTVLTKRVEFLVKYRSVVPGEILAITFTRKARRQMQERLKKLGVRGVKIHTFNSYCEGILRKYGDIIYGRPVRVQSYADKVLAMNIALANLGIDMESALDDYFSIQQKKFKTAGQLSNSFMNDCFSVMDYFKTTGQDVYDFSKEAEPKNKKNALMIYNITRNLKEHMEIQGLRDFTDQMIDAINFLKENPDRVPFFSHILIDEYQDVNALQTELLDLHRPKNVFAVGDPRQSIFGWRGSDIRYILDFEKNYRNSQVIHLKKNYRSSDRIVNFMNHAIKGLGLPDLENHLEINGAEIRILDFDSEESERIFVVESILRSDLSKEDIFVLARTNRQLMEISQLMKRKKIPHILKTDEVRNPVEEIEGAITLATIHAIKGLEAKQVYVVGCNEQNFPCKTSDHPAIEMIKTDRYDKLEEERRLFYVAISRAKENLFLTYSGKRSTYFITDEMRKMI